MITVADRTFRGLRKKDVKALQHTVESPNAQLATLDLVAVRRFGTSTVPFVGVDTCVRNSLMGESLGRPHDGPVCLRQEYAWPRLLTQAVGICDFRGRVLVWHGRKSAALGLHPDMAAGFAR